MLCLLLVLERIGGLELAVAGGAVHGRQFDTPRRNGHSIFSRLNKSRSAAVGEDFYTDNFQFHVSVSIGRHYICRVVRFPTPRTATLFRCP
jgi:hypothetical protein